MSEQSEHRASGALGHAGFVMSLVGFLIAASACGDEPAVAADATTTADALAFDGAPAAACTTTSTSTVMVDTQTFGFAALGNIDAGGESACGGPPEAVMIVLAVDASASNDAQTWRIDLKLPLAIGQQTVTMTQGTTSTTVVVDVKSVVIDGAGPALREVTATVSGAATGQFTAMRCAQHDTSCI